jgi:myosin heavy subunit
MDALHLEDRQKSMGGVFKELGPIMKVMTKAMESSEKEKAKEEEEEAKHLRRSAESAMRELKTETSKLETKKKNSLKLLDAAKIRQATAQTASALKRADTSCQLHEGHIEEYDTRIEELRPRYISAKAALDALIILDEARELVASTAEATYQAALAREKEEAEATTIEEKERMERRKKLQQRPSDAVAHWKETISSAEIEEEKTKDLQENVMLDPYQPRLPYGWYLAGKEGEHDDDNVAAPIEKDLSPEELEIFNEECRAHSNIDPGLLMLSVRQA